MGGDNGGAFGPVVGSADRWAHLPGDGRGPKQPTRLERKRARVGAGVRLAVGGSAFASLVGLVGWWISRALDLSQFVPATGGG